MKRLLLFLSLFAPSAATAAVPPYYGTTISTATGKATSQVSGTFNVAKSSLTASTPTVTLDGTTGIVFASSGVFVGSVTARAFAGDGSQLTGTGGGVALTVANVFTTTNTFAAARITGLFHQGGLGSGRWITIASGTVVNVSTLTLTGLASSTTYRLSAQTFLLTGPSNAANPYIVYNQAGVAVYSASTFYDQQSNLVHNSAVLNNGDFGIKYCPLAYEVSNANDVNTGQMFDTTFSTVYGSSVNIRSFTNYHGTGTTATRPVMGQTACYYTGQIPLADIELFFAAVNEGAGGATWSGKYSLEKWSE